MLAGSYVALTRLYYTREDYVSAAEQYNGFVDLVRAKITRQNASTVWLGLQVAKKVNDKDSLASLELQMKNQFADSPEYQEYLAWK
jgi:type IV pilus assembly protein PilF